MEAPKLTGKHILLLLIYSPGNTGRENEAVVGRTRITKMMFLFDKEIRKAFLKNSDIELISFPNFEAWHYGPFSKQVYDDIEFFLNNGYLSSEPLLNTEKSEFELNEYENWMDEYLFDEERELLSGIRNEESFELTSKGERFVKDRIYGRLTANQRKIVAQFKRSINNASLEAILRYVYLKYPEYTEKSKIRGRILGRP